MRRASRNVSNPSYGHALVVLRIAVVACRSAAVSGRAWLLLIRRPHVSTIELPIGVIGSGGHVLRGVGRQSGLAPRLNRDDNARDRRAFLKREVLQN